MRKAIRLFKPAELFMFLSVMLIFTISANALELELDPASKKIAEGCEVSVNIYADNASNLISMGVKVSYDPAVVEVVSATKNEDFNTGWVMDSDGDPETTGDQYMTPLVEIDNAGGTVIIIGGRLMGSGTVGLTGRVLLGTIIFKGLSNGISDLNVDLGRYHPEDPAHKFDNFVNIDGTVDEPTNANTVLGSVCVKLAGDVNGDGVVNIIDKVQVRNHFGESGDPGWIDADVNCDGVVNIIDKVSVRNSFGQSGLACP